MEKYITDERTGLQYELVGDYYLLAGDDESAEESVGIWGTKHLQYIREHNQSLYNELLQAGKLNAYLVDIDKQAESMLQTLMKQMAERDGVTETLKAADQMEWVRRMNNIRNAAVEVISHDILYC